MVGVEKIAVEKRAVEKNVAASSQSDKMGAAPIRILVWQMSLPPLISMFIQYSYNLVDSMFVAQVSEQALRQGVLLVPLMWVLDQVLGMTGIWLAFPVTEVVVCVLAVGVGLHGRRMYKIG